MASPMPLLPPVTTATLPSESPAHRGLIAPGAQPAFRLSRAASGDAPACPCTARAPGPGALPIVSPTSPDAPHAGFTAGERHDEPRPERDPRVRRHRVECLFHDVPRDRTLSCSSSSMPLRLGCHGERQGCRKPLSSSRRCWPERHGSRAVRHQEEAGHTTPQPESGRRCRNAGSLAPVRLRFRHRLSVRMDGAKNGEFLEECVIVRAL